jgi:hypothetical protein
LDQRKNIALDEMDVEIFDGKAHYKILAFYKLRLSEPEKLVFWCNRAVVLHLNKSASRPLTTNRKTLRENLK